MDNKFPGKDISEEDLKSKFPLASSINGSVIDTFLFFLIAFYATGIPWFTLAIGDLAVKLFVALLMLIPFRILLKTFKPI